MFSVSNSVDSAKGPDPKTLLAAERAQQKWDPVLMNYFLEGSKEVSEMNKRLIQQMERDPILRANPHFYDLSKPEQRELTALKIDRVSQYLEQDSVEEYTRRASLISVFDPQLNVRIGVNLGLFLHCIRGNGTAEQLKYWSATKEDKILKGIYGCFAMTELAHGSNVAGLETTATFDKERDEFVINTPHIGATKWWIGGAAHSATHTACYARLIVDGEDYGVKTFVVPLRDSNHKLMPGITVGDIGAKMGRDGIDNGWIQFSSVRVPRFFMLQKFCKVNREGEVTLPPLEQLSYSALLGGRVTMVMDSYRINARFTTIALRYAIGRRQFKTSGPEETQLLDYPLHQRRLLPYLALTYLISSGAYKLENTMNGILNTLDDAVVKNDMKIIMKSINDLKSLFIDSASLKSTCTWLAADCIDQCRQACGGHGYSAYNGFGKAFNDWVVQCTWEGDNNVLALSVGKPLIRSIDEILNKGKKASGSISFLNNAKEYLNENNILNNLDDVSDLDKNLLAIEVLIIRLCKDSLDTIKESKGQYEVVSAAMVNISKLKAHHYLLTEFLARVKSAESSIKPYLELIAKLYTSTMVFGKFSGDFLTYSVVSPKLMGKINQVHIPQLCLEIRPLTVNYTDSFQQSDMMLNAPIGNFNGDIYENYFNVVKQENNPFHTKAPYSAALEAMLNRSSLSDRERNEKTEEVKSILSK